MPARTLLVSLCVVLIPAHGHAQESLALTVGGGVSAPTGPMQATADPGWHAQISLTYGGPIHPWSLRLDAAHQEFVRQGGTTGSGAPRATSLALGTTYRLPRTNSVWSPYIAAAGGGYRVGCVGTGACRAITAGGWNAGAGVRFVTLGMHTMLEARYHRVHVSGSDVQFVPVTFGITL